MFDFQYLKGTTNQRDNNEKLTQVINNQFVNYLSYQPNRKAIWFEYIINCDLGFCGGCEVFLIQKWQQAFNDLSFC